jgi:hypothetical protein
MFKTLVALLGIGVATIGHAGQQSPSGFTPYKDPALNTIYNLLFCDNLDLFRTKETNSQEGPWKILLAKDPNLAALRILAEDPSQESRLRMLAYNRLRAHNERVPKKKLLGVIVEVGMESGLEVLAAFADGRVRYLNQFERLAVLEPAPANIDAKIRKLLNASQSAVNQIGPWDKARLKPPSGGTLRMTFLVSDGLYFGQGPIQEMERDPVAGPIIAASLELLQGVVDKAK